MAIAHLATEYVFSDFLLKEPAGPQFQGLRLELAADKVLTCVAVGLPLLLISLAFAQEISVGTQISCFSPSSFSWRQAAFVDAYCWASVGQVDTSQPLWLHKFFPYILLLVAIVLYLPSLFWRFTAAPHLCSDLKFIMEELDKVYNRAIKAIKSAREQNAPDGDCPGPGAGLSQSPCELSERQFHYPIVEQFLRSKRGARGLVATYLGCRLLSLVALAAACAYLAFYLGFAASSDEFACSVRSGVLANDSSVPPRFQCKLVAVGVFRLLGGLQLAVYLALLPAAAYALCLPLRGRARVLRAYQLLPSVDVQALTARRFDDLSLYLLFLEENAGELKSYRCLSVLQHLQSTPGADPLLLLACLGLVRTDALDGRPRHPHGPATELTDLAASGDKQTNHEDKSARQRLLNSS